MCLCIKKQTVFKVLYPDYISPDYRCQWKKHGRMESGRGTGLTYQEVFEGVVSKGLHFYNSPELCRIRAYNIIVACHTYSIFARNDRESVALDCHVGEVIYGQWLVDLYEEKGIKTMFTPRVNSKAICVLDYLPEYAAVCEKHKKEVRDGAWKQKLTIRS